MVLDRQRRQQRTRGPTRSDYSNSSTEHSTTPHRQTAARMHRTHVPADSRRSRPDRAFPDGELGQRLVLQVDATPGVTPSGVAGIGIVVRHGAGDIVRWHCTRAPAQTCNEAEYQAIIAGFTFMRTHFPTASIRCLTDSRIAVDQLNGMCAIRALGLQPLHRRAMELRQHFDVCEIIAIPREYNRLADALAWEALSGQRTFVALVGGA